ncbi:MAG: efflux RND transporter periplasmic adaptor subunit [Labilithrix sp.]
MSRSRAVFFVVLVAACHPKADATTTAANADAGAKDDDVDVTLGPKALEAAQLKTVKPRSIVKRTSVVAAGKVDFVPSRVARVGPPIAGRVSTIPVVPGQRVGRGAMLVTVDSVEVGRARGDFTAAKTRAAQAKAEVEREHRLSAGGASSERALLAAQAEAATADAELRAAQDRLSTLGLGAGAAGQSVGLVAPIAGTVLQLNARVGQPVGPTDTLVVVGETEQVWLTADIYERDVGKVHLADDVHVTSIAFPGRIFEGKVDQIGAIVDPERHVLEARIVLPNEDGALKPGMTASARILGASASDAGTVMVVPRGAIQTVDGQPFVFTEKKPGQYAMRPVERGEQIENDVEVLRGISLEDSVVFDGAFILKSEVLKSQMGTND